MKNISNQNNQTKSSFHRAHKKKAPGLVFQLWGMMMGLVALTAVFMWLVQVFLFEHTYAEAALSTSLKLTAISRRMTSSFRSSAA